MLSESRANAIAVAALNWLAGEEELIASFLAMNGASVENLPVQAANPDFLGFVLDYILLSDELVLACANEIGEKPENIAIARNLLPGGEQIHWT